MTRDELRETVARAIDATDESPRMIDCPRCKGKGYHHGFGEDGHDPDWCEDCGGPGTIQDPMQRADAALAAIEREHVIVTRTQHQQDGAKS